MLVLRNDLSLTRLRLKVKVVNSLPNFSAAGGQPGIGNELAELACVCFRKFECNSESMRQGGKETGSRELK